MVRRDSLPLADTLVVSLTQRKDHTLLRMSRLGLLCLEDLNRKRSGPAEQDKIPTADLGKHLEEKKQGLHGGKRDAVLW